ncbi:MAG: hypothetical protein R6W90_04925, partial [Ignavibacteriaceae bacterium]
MKKTLLLLSAIIILLCSEIISQNVNISYDSSSPQINYAAKVLSRALADKGYSVKNDNSGFVITLQQNPEAANDEAFDLKKNGSAITISGGLPGVIYGAHSLAEDINNGVALNEIKDKSEIPNLLFRGIKFDLPWDTYRHSYSLDQHRETCSNLNYWEAFLDMMSTNRFNALTLWNLHPYTFLVKPKNFPESSPWNDNEMKEWKELFSGIFRMAKERGIDTYIMPFNIFVTPEFSKAYNAAMDNLEHHHFVKGDTSEVIKRYTREAVTQMLQEYPDLTGMGLTLGEGMGGMTPQQREDWMKETIIEGMRLAGRKSKLIHRIPFSGSTASLGATTIEMEQVTRKGIEQEAVMDFIEGPVWADLKFNWSHAHSTPRLIKVHGGKLYGTYWEPEPEGYKIIWTARNEDFFCLRWGAADFIREHIAQNTPSYVGGYLIGSETYIPAKDYFTNPDIKVPWDYAFQRQWLFYKLWGRLLYNPGTPDEIFKKEFIRRYGQNTEILFEAYQLASRTQLRLVSSFDCGWDFTMYSEGFSALDPEVQRVDYISIDRQINHPPLDTTYVSIAEYVKTMLDGGSFESGRTTPPELAQMLEDDCSRALKLIENINPGDNTPLMFETADVKVWANLGLYFAEKIKGGIALQTYRLNGGEENKEDAVRYLENALQYWDTVISITRPIYNDMPLVHYSEQDGKSWKENDHLRFHWALL